jgi:hypothetical protein
MPTYVYESVEPPHERFEISQRMADPALTRHPDTGVPVRRVISGGLGFMSHHGDGASAQAPCGNPNPPAGGCGSGQCGHSHH